jgi:hypothetical protein
MDRKTAIILSSIALLVGFFLPYLKDGALHYSAYTIVFGKTGAGQASAIRFLWLLIPLSAIILLLRELGDKDNEDIFSWLPLLTVIFFIIRTYLVVKKNVVAGQSASLSDFIKIIGTGFWITLAASLVLAFTKPKK